MAQALFRLNPDNAFSIGRLHQLRLLALLLRRADVAAIASHVHATARETLALILDTQEAARAQSQEDDPAPDNYVAFLSGAVREALWFVDVARRLEPTPAGNDRIILAIGGRATAALVSCPDPVVRAHDWMQGARTQVPTADAVYLVASNAAAEAWLMACAPSEARELSRRYEASLVAA